MPYNSYVPYYYNYYNPYQQTAQVQPNNNQMQNPLSSTQPSNDIIWVQGEAGAKAYLVAPNSTVVLWDTENPTIYVKSSDSKGLPSLRILDFKERSVQAQNPLEVSKTADNGNFRELTDRVDQLKTRYDEIELRIKDLEAKALAPKGKKEKETD